MFNGQQIAAVCVELGVTHVITVPDSTIGSWGTHLEKTPGIRVVRVCREGEAWAIAGGLHLAGATPLVLIQCTGLFESGDSLRNMIYDWKLPLMSIIGYRSYLDQTTLPGDTCLTFTEPILKAWNLDYLLVKEANQLTHARDHLARRRAQGKAGVALIAEGRA